MNTNKGFDMTLEALTCANYHMKEEKMDTTIVMFFITKAPITPSTRTFLRQRAMLEEIRQNVEGNRTEVGSRSCLSMFFPAIIPKCPTSRAL
ncbi:MAG: hypothetical protein R3B47_14860 [Bacteroidia bacterium]